MRIRLFLLVLLAGTLTAQAQVWTDAASLPLYGKATEETITHYSRFPAYLEGECRPPVWERGQHSTGLYIRSEPTPPLSGCAGLQPPPIL